VIDDDDIANGVLIEVPQERTLQERCDAAADILDGALELLVDHPYEWGQVTAVQDFLRGGYGAIG
jgi:hypothetical protein